MTSGSFRTRADAEIVSRTDGVSIRRLIDEGGVSLAEYTVPRGFSTGPSDHEMNDKVGYIVSGVVEIRTASSKVTLGAGSAYHLPRGAAHEFTVVEDAVIVQVRTPSEA
ncbi:MAG: cupin domain-containing protein [Chloroflexi bacterium]|nr:cupin domain-containing protein [Chloroflexota bacterium]